MLLHLVFVDGDAETRTRVGTDEAALLRAGPAGALTVTRASPAPAPAPSLPLFGDAL